ncbi:ATP-binding protein [Cellulosimicrobium cellulans]|uniref:HAMP domain-containing sensor histidine kinase n=1 Tax=Cellulosimicrobium cellulans TaxID=1710 RepID=UPI0036ED48A0
MRHATSRLLSWRTWSIRARIVSTTAVLSLAAMAVLVVLIDLALDRAVDASVAELLQARADATVDGAVEGTSPDEASGDAVWVFDPSGTLVSGPSGSPLDDAASHVAGAPAGTVTEHDEWLLLSDDLPGGRGSIVVATSLEPYETTRRLSLLTSLLLGVLVVAAVTALTAMTVGRALRPVRSMAQDASRWSEHDLDRRFALGPARDEITELGAVLDRLLERVAQVLRAEQRLTAELAHELRTPLTVVRAEAELAAHQVGIHDADRERLERIVAATVHMNAVIDTLLSAARGSVAARVRTPVDDVLDAATSGPAMIEGGPSVVVHHSPELVTSTPLDVAARALSPLVANATRYGRSRVTVSAHLAGTWVAIDVEDDGPGVSDDQAEAVFDPGHRAPESPGAGLGLPLARRVARASGGEVELVSSTPALFRLTLPAAR